MIEKCKPQADTPFTETLILPNFTAAIIGMNTSPEKAKHRLRELLKMMRAELEHIHAIAFKKILVTALT